MDFCNQLKKDIEGILPRFTCGRGIVILGGGMRYFINAYLNVKLLRKLGCELPIEWFYIQGEVDGKTEDRQRKIIQEIDGVEFIELNNLPVLTPSFAREGGGWQSKLFAVEQSSFSELLYLDADCFSIINPAFLFESEEYRMHGLLMWYDGFSWDLYPEWFQKDYKQLEQFGVDFKTARTVELGQFVLNKDQHINSVLFAREINRWWHRTYNWSLGDKETLLIGCSAYSEPFYIVPRFPDIIDNAFVHYSLDCSTHLFSHCFRSKWDVDAKCKTTSNVMPYKKEMEEWCHELILRTR